MSWPATPPTTSAPPATSTPPSRSLRKSPDSALSSLATQSTRLRFIICLLSLNLVLFPVLTGCRPANAKIPSNWNSVELVFRDGKMRPTFRIPPGFTVWEAFRKGGFEVYFIQAEEEHSMGIAVTEVLRENISSRYPTAIVSRSGQFARKSRRVQWKMGTYSDSDQWWAEIIVPPRGRSPDAFQLWYAHVPRDVADDFDIIVKQFLESL